MAIRRTCWICDGKKVQTVSVGSLTDAMRQRMGIRGRSTQGQVKIDCTACGGKGWRYY